MARILFLAHRIPYPPNKGDKIRSWNILKHLSERHEVHLGAFIDDQDDWRHVPVLQEVCADTHFVGLNPKMARLKSLRGLLNGEPLSAAFYRSADMAAWVEKKLAGADAIDRVFVFSSGVAQFVLKRAPAGAHFVMDFVDIDSDKWAQYAKNHKGPMAWLYRREAKTLLAHERLVARAADASLFVSPEEAALFRGLAPEAASKVHALKNGVDHRYFSPDPAFPRPFPDGRPALVFTGAMDYWANVEAVTWFARQVLPRIQAARGDAGFWIVGGKPAPAVLALAGLPGVTVTGQVEDVRPYTAHADVVVAPLRIARGVQNKVLEGMAMARPVVATSQAAQGIDCLAGKELWVQDGEAEFADACLRALDLTASDPMATRARARILRSYDWEANLAGLDRFLELAPAAISEPFVPQSERILPQPANAS